MEAYTQAMPDFAAPYSPPDYVVDAIVTAHQEGERRRRDSARWQSAMVHADRLAERHGLKLLDVVENWCVGACWAPRSAWMDLRGAGFLPSRCPMDGRCVAHFRWVTHAAVADARPLVGGRAIVRRRGDRVPATVLRVSKTHARVVLATVVPDGRRDPAVETVSGHAGPVWVATLRDNGRYCLRSCGVEVEFGATDARVAEWLR